LLEIAIPGGEIFRLQHLILDFNGTLACDGALMPGVASGLRRLAKDLAIHVVTADTSGRAKESLVDIPCELTVLLPQNQDMAKLHYMENLEPSCCVCIGNGRNDRLMIEAAVVGIAVMQLEGAAVETILAAKVVVSDIDSALGLLLNPSRLIATLRR
jgi:soluble P-type ATPase